MAESSFSFSSDDDVDGVHRPAKSSSPTVSQKFSFNNNNADECSSKKVADRAQTRTTFKSFPGARKRKSGKWSAEIRDPFVRRRIWLGTFNTPQEASNAYAAKKLEIRERKEAESHLGRSGEQIYAEWNQSGGINDVELNRKRNWSAESIDAEWNWNCSGKQIDVRSEEQIDAGMNWEPILTDSNRLLLGDKLSNLDDDPTALNKFLGAHRRPSGRWSSEIRDPFTRRRICLGTFDTPQEASNAFAAKKLEFRKRKEAESYKNSTLPKCDSGRSGGAGLNPEPILVDNNGFLLGEFSNLDDDLIIS